MRRALFPFVLAALTAATAAAADPIAFRAALDPGAEDYSLFWIDVSRLKNQTETQARAHLESQMAPYGRKPAFVAFELNAGGVTTGALHLGAGPTWTYNRETFLTTVENNANIGITLDSGVKQSWGADFRTPVLVTDPTDPGHPITVHSDVLLSQFGFLVQTTAAAGGVLMTDTLRFEVVTDANGDGVPDTLVLDHAMTVDLVEFVGIEVPTGFQDVTVIPVGGPNGAWVADRFSYVPWTAPAGVRAGNPASPGAGPATPSPSRGNVTLQLSLPRAGHVIADVYSIDGRRARSLFDAEAPAGNWTLAWDGRDRTGAPAGPGVYFVRISVGGSVVTRRVVLVP